MQIARRVTDFVVHRHPEVLAVAVHGSTGHGEDREHSDLEMFAITEGKSDTSYYQIVHEGIVVEVGFVALEDARREVREVPWDWPISVDGWIHVLATHDPQGLLPELGATAAEPDPQQMVTRVRSAYTTLFEDLCKMRNFATSGEDVLLRFMSPNIAQYGAARFLAFLNRQYFNGVRNLMTKPRDFRLLPPHFWEDYPRLLAADGSSRELLACAERIHEECRDLFLASGHAHPEGLPLEQALERGRVPRFT